jgi:hypothetical protein
MFRLLGRKKGQRDARRPALLAAQARPECGVDDGGNRQRRRRLEIDAIAGSCRRDVAGEMSLHRVGDEACGRIGRYSHNRHDVDER